MPTFMFEDNLGPVPAHQHPNGGGWVADTAIVAETAYVGPNARIYGYAQVYDEAQVSGYAQVYGKAHVSDNARVYGNAHVYGEARVSGNVYGYAQVYDEAQVSGYAQVYGKAHVYGEARVSGNAHVYGEARVSGNVYDNVHVSGNAHVLGIASGNDHIKDTVTQVQAPPITESEPMIVAQVEEPLDTRVGDIVTWDRYVFEHIESPSGQPKFRDIWSGMIMERPPLNRTMGVITNIPPKPSDDAKFGWYPVKKEAIRQGDIYRTKSNLHQVTADNPLYPAEEEIYRLGWHPYPPTWIPWVGVLRKGMVFRPAQSDAEAYIVKILAGGYKAYYPLPKAGETPSQKPVTIPCNTKVEVLCGIPPWWPGHGWVLGWCDGRVGWVDTRSNVEDPKPEVETEPTLCVECGSPSLLVKDNHCADCATVKFVDVRVHRKPLPLFQKPPPRPLSKGARYHLERTSVTATESWED